MTKTFDELMEIIKYGSEQDKAVLLLALLMEKEKRTTKKKLTKLSLGDAKI